MKKTLFLLSAFVTLMCCFSTYGQVTKTDSASHWKRKLDFGINLNQAAFSNNWKGGGISSVGLSVQLNGRADYKNGRHSWTNELDALFGFIYQKESGYRKTLDRLYLDSKYGYTLNKKWSLFTSLNFLTQFAEGYDTESPQRLISEIFAPAYITSAWGVSYTPADYFELRLSPFAPRLTIVNDPRRFVDPVGPIPYGVDSTKNTRFELFAFQLFADFDKELTKNISLKCKYLLFVNYETLDIKKVDHRLDLNLIAKIGKYINVSVGGILLYDYDQDKDVQLNQLFTLGAAYSIKNFEEKSK